MPWRASRSQRSKGARDGQVEQVRVLLAPLDAGMAPRQRVVEIVADVLVELLVLLVADLAPRPRPERGSLVDGLLVGELFLLAVLPLLLLHEDRLDDVVGVLADDGAQLPAVQQVVLAFAQVQRDVGAAVRLLDHLDDEFAAAVGLPAHALVGLLAGAARTDGHLVGDDERGVEADAELADQMRVLLLVAGQLREEFARARLGDGAEVARSPRRGSCRCRCRRR